VRCLKEKERKKEGQSNIIGEGGRPSRVQTARPMSYNCQFWKTSREPSEESVVFGKVEPREEGGQGREKKRPLKAKKRTKTLGGKKGGHHNPAGRLEKKKSPKGKMKRKKKNTRREGSNGERDRGGLKRDEKKKQALPH